MKLRFAHCDGALPVPPGESPFHIKGEFYRQVSGTIDHFDQRTSGAVRAALARDGLGDFAAQKFLASSLYDVLPLPRIFMALASALRKDVDELTRRTGKNAIEQALKGGIYHSLFARLTPGNFAERFGAVLAHIYDFAPALVTRDADGNGASMVREGMPLCIAEWWCLVTVPFVEAPLTTNGAHDLAIAWQVEPRGSRANVPLGRVAWKLRWRSS